MHAMFPYKESSDARPSRHRDCDLKQLARYGKVAKYPEPLCSKFLDGNAHADHPCLFDWLQLQLATENVHIAVFPTHLADHRTGFPFIDILLHLTQRLQRS
jgi:hypothetical protein